ncbi:cache domain-containing sensor histidine kinase [Paenibacillus sp. 1P07SE]|uniref:cache domain-containing sensor histidine kinase n=1 Tax=Paenibacillus sp. 1P07SE TaxID=3132209 RepID=UPI0039A6AB86
MQGKLNKTRWITGLPVPTIRVRLFLLLLTAMLIPTLLVSSIAQYYMLRAGAVHSIDQSSQMMRYVANELDKQLLSMEQQLNGIVLDPEFQKYLAVPKTDIRSQAAAQISFRPLVDSFLRSNADAVGFLYLDKKDKVYFESLHNISLQIDYPFAEDPVYQSIHEINRTVLLPPHEQAYTLLRTREVYSLVRPVYQFSTNQISAWIVIELAADSLYDAVQSVELAPSSRNVIYDAHTRKLLTPGAWSDSLEPALLPLLPGIDTPSGSFQLQAEGISYQAVYEPVRFSNWRLIGITPLEELMRASHQTQRLTWFVALAGLLIAGLIAFPIMDRVLRPLHRLKRGMRSLSRGSYVPITDYPKDEFGFLIETYNNMLNDLRRMEQEVYQSKLNEKEKELLQLQAQINPHFFFNTLQTIESYVETADSLAVEEIIQSVSRMMRYNVRNDGGWAPLSEEMDHIRDLLEIHRYRTDQAVQAELLMAPELAQMPVMKLSIQPFVENALKYGWLPGNANFRITVLVQQAEDGVLIEIRDNGQGMSAETLQRLRALRPGGAADPAFFERHTGIRNVYRRLLLVYGEQFELTLSSRPHQGTTVRIRIPLRLPEGTIQ